MISIFNISPFFTLISKTFNSPVSERVNKLPTLKFVFDISIKSESSLILSLDNNYKSILEEQNELIRVSKLNTLSLFNKYINSDFNVIAANKEYNASKLALNGVKKEEEFGLRTLLDVLDIEVDLMNSEVRLLKSKSDQLLNKYKLLIDIGKYNF